MSIIPKSEIKSEKFLGSNVKLTYSTTMDSKQIIDTVKSGAFSEAPPKCCILEPNAPKPAPPDCPAQTLTREQLLLSTPSIVLENRNQTCGPLLEEFCLKHPIVVVRKLTAALELDLSLFSSKTLVETSPNHPIEVRLQEHQGPDENWDASQGKQVWKCTSQRTRSTIIRYANYQSSSYQDSVKEQVDEGAGVTMSSDSSRMDSFSASVWKKRKSKQFNSKYLKFGTNVDLSDERKWSLQLKELTKLPAFTRVASAANMLSHVGHTILGVNTVQLYMKVQGCRTGGHQENNNFCSVNINIGPGDCEWFAVPEEYWGGIQQLCVKNDIDYLHGSWWPNMKDLLDSNIPVYRFIQRPGDLVWVNIGCVHWVYSRGWCNNIAWNVGPLTARQYSMAIERYEWNKLQHYMSVIPMVHLSWNLARNIKVSDRKLFHLIKNCLFQSLRHVIATLEFVKSKNVNVEFHGRDNNASHYCEQC
ncbi:Lysine-specific demethylase 6A, partial [Pseudolycoriella hygida]